jgi:hypothetical protein
MKGEEERKEDTERAMLIYFFIVTIKKDVAIFT